MADRLVNKFCLLFFRTYPDLVWQHTRGSLFGYLKDSLGMPAEANRMIEAALAPAGKGLPLLLATTQAPGGFNSLTGNIAHRIADLVVVRDEPPTDVLPGLRSTSMARRNTELLRSYEAILKSGYFTFVNRLNDASLVLLILLAFGAGASLQCLERGTGFLVVGAALTAIFYLVAVSVLLVHLPRYQLPYQLLIAASLGVILSRLPERLSHASPVK